MAVKGDRKKKTKYKQFKMLIIVRKGWKKKQMQNTKSYKPFFFSDIYLLTNYHRNQCIVFLTIVQITSEINVLFFVTIVQITLEEIIVLFPLNFVPHTMWTK